MTDNHTHRAGHARPRRTLWRIAVLSSALALVAGIAAAMALASSSVTIGSVDNSSLGEHILVSKGRTLYELSPETTRHLLCKSAECLRFWPPLTVSSTKEKIELGPGVHGKVGTFKRSNGELQVTIDGLPLYWFAEDKSAGEINGQNFKDFGGVWHVLGTSGQPSSKAPATSNAPASKPESSTSSSSSEASGSGGYTY